MQLVTSAFSDYRCINRQRVLYLDLSEWVQRDVHTGIQRVVRALARHWLARPPAGYTVIPVCATADRGYRIFAGLDRLGLPPPEWAAFEGAVPLVRQGDVVFGLDFAPVIVRENRDFFSYARCMGARVWFHLHDIICLRRPEWFPESTAEGFLAWLEVALLADGVVCVSRSVMHDLSAWLGEQSVTLRAGFELRYSLNGVDVDASVPTAGPSVQVNHLLRRNEGRAMFLMVGTLEPRKAHAEALRAFEAVWRQGLSPVLVIVGRPGWRCTDLVEGLRTHPRLNTDVFWLDDVSDEALTDLYRGATCLLAASHDEGFGLPVAEAMYHGLPVLARDIPVFREVAGEAAVYFQSRGPDDMVVAIARWAQNRPARSGTVRSASHLPTWAESANNLERVLGL